MVEIIRDIVKDQWEYNRNFRILCIIMVAVLAISFVGTTISIGKMIFASTYTYIGQVQKVEMTAGKVYLKVKSLGSGIGILSAVSDNDKDPWTHIYQDEGSKEILVTRFSQTMTYKTDEMNTFKIGDIVKLKARNSKIKEINLASETDIVNALTPVIRGKYVGYLEKPGDILSMNQKVYILKFKVKSPKIKGADKAVELKVYEDIYKSMNLEIDKYYEVKKEYDQAGYTKHEWTAQELKME